MGFARPFRVLSHAYIVNGVKQRGGYIDDETQQFVLGERLHKQSAHTSNERLMRIQAEEQRQQTPFSKVGRCLDDSGAAGQVKTGRETQMGKFAQPAKLPFRRRSFASSLDNDKKGFAPPRTAKTSLIPAVLSRQCYDINSQSILPAMESPTHLANFTHHRLHPQILCSPIQTSQHKQQQRRRRRTTHANPIPLLL